ncbi:hypothetical protein BM221_001687 [Beauveria bassiana]|uniref:Uncharacterized protein n=1 Tax=Beauveria bassiana TaxID=176275 RepID=A0A2N6NWG4_BEABA|nr:hypothetical protein BM221_001687 [Beauveria bassiana]
MEQKERSPSPDTSTRPTIEAPTQTPKDEKKDDGDGSFKYYLLADLDKRVFKYNDTQGWIINSFAFLCMIASGTTLPLMDVVFGSYVNAFNHFVAGTLSPAGYRKEVAHYAYVVYASN